MPACGTRRLRSSRAGLLFRPPCRRPPSRSRSGAAIPRWCPSTSMSRTGLKKKYPEPRRQGAGDPVARAREAHRAFAAFGRRGRHHRAAGLDRAALPRGKPSEAGAGRRRRRVVSRAKLPTSRMSREERRPSTARSTACRSSAASRRSTTTPTCSRRPALPGRRRRWKSTPSTPRSSRSATPPATPTVSGWSLRLTGGGQGIAEKFWINLHQFGGALLKQTSDGKWIAGYATPAGRADAQAVCRERAGPEDRDARR